MDKNLALIKELVRAANDPRKGSEIARAFVALQACQLMDTYGLRVVPSNKPISLH
jgi:hypothetical protein